MKSGIQYIASLGLSFLFLFACSEPEVPEQPDNGLAQVNVSVGKAVDFGMLPETRVPSYSTNRILVLPFQKLDTSLPDDNADNYVPAWNFAHQWDVNSFPVQSLTLGLLKSFTYKVMVIGYQQSDYDYYNQGAVSNLVELATQPTPTTLANFQLAPKSAWIVPEFFACFLTASQDGTPIGTVFTPGDNTSISLSGQLKRFVSGLSVTVTGIPGYVKSMTLVAEKMVKAVVVNDTTASAVQVSGDNENRVIQKLVPSAGTVNFNVFLLPTLSTNMSKYSLVVEYDSTTETYQIQVPDSEVSQGNSIILLANGMVNITGSYATINIGFEISRTINLDDPAWDGIN